MSRRVLAVLVALLPMATPARAGELFDEETLTFASQVDTRTLSLLAVVHNGRVTILDTLARDALARAYGREEIDGTDPAFAWLELHWNAGKYLDKPVLQVPERAMRAWILNHLPADAAAEFRATWRLPPAAIVDEKALEELVKSGRATVADIERAGRVPSLLAGLGPLYARPEYRLPLQRLDERYLAAISTESASLVLGSAGGVFVVGPGFEYGERALVRRLRFGASSWMDMEVAWRSRDANAVNSMVGQLAAAYPYSGPRPPWMELELYYNRLGKGAAAWVGFALAAAFLIVAAASRGRWPRLFGISFLALSTLVALAAFAVRWVLSGREWYLPPVMNMFEAVTGSALLVGLLAIGLELAWGRTRPGKSGQLPISAAEIGNCPGFPVQAARRAQAARRMSAGARLYVALAASLYAAAAYGFCYFLRGSIGGGIAPMHGILESPLMAAHVTVIILGHALAGMTLILSLIYLVLVALGKRGLSPFSAAENGDCPLFALDRCNLVLVQLATWTLALGTALGALWADAAWGRWWGWDRKETWALITVLIYVAALHARLALPARSRGVATACLCILGGAAMLFNWIAVNFLLPGLHSYA